MTTSSRAGSASAASWTASATSASTSITTATSLPISDPTGLKKLGVEKIVLLDMAVVEVKYSACNLVWRSAFQRQRT